MEKFDVTGMTCAACSAHVERAVRGVEGVKEVTVSLLTNSMTVDFSSPATAEKICAAVSAAGYGAAPQNIGGKKENKKSTLESGEPKKILYRLIASAVLLLPLMYVSMGHLMWGWPLPEIFASDPLARGLYQLLLTTAVAVINQRFFISGTKSLFHARRIWIRSSPRERGGIYIQHRSALRDVSRGGKRRYSDRHASPPRALL